MSIDNVLGFRSGRLSGEELMDKPGEERLSRSEAEYRKFFKSLEVSNPAPGSDTDSLEQPSPLHIVPTVTTYGCLEVASADE
jgi:hypothetical protein